MNLSPQQIWNDYLETFDQTDAESSIKPSIWHFCDNKKDANECVQLVLSGKKQATSPSVWELKSLGKKIPEVGDLHIITDWDGFAQCIIQTTNVTIVPFNQITEEHARMEGEGDGSLKHWRKVHWNYYQRVLKGTEYIPSKDMPIVCEKFEVIYPKSLAT